MRQILFAFSLILTASTAMAQEGSADSCAQTEAWFNAAVEGRKAGSTKAAVRRGLKGDMGYQAADQLVDFVFALPDAQLTPEVGAMARKQCEGL